MRVQEVIAKYPDIFGPFNFCPKTVYQLTVFWGAFCHWITVCLLLGMHRILIWPDIRLTEESDTGYPAGYKETRYRISGRVFCSEFIGPLKYVTKVSFWNLTRGFCCLLRIYVYKKKFSLQSYEKLFFYHIRLFQYPAKYSEHPYLYYPSNPLTLNLC
jgi:hypothetical protein